jgi:hypothetical protein
LETFQQNVGNDTIPSTIPSISIFYNEQAEAFDLDELLKPLVEEVKQLEDGVEFKVNGKKETFYGTVTATLGDNLSSHLVGGFYGRIC